jgi:creatinine amidohydrolase/Fe(II)-dependent formamide hydrolase-like protein
MKKTIAISLTLLAFCFNSLIAQVNVTFKSNGLSAEKQDELKLNGNTVSDSGKVIHQTPRCWRWEQMNPGDLEQAIKTNPVVYLVLSPLEWHSEAMAFGCDPLQGTVIAEKAWRETGGVLIPTLYIGTETQYHDWTDKGLTDYWGMEWITKEHNPGSLYISALTLELVMREMLSFIEQDGFKVCVIVSGHEGTEHVKVLRDLEQRAKGHPMKIIYSQLVDMKVPQELEFPGDAGHAGFGEASVLGGIDSTLVDKNKFGKIQRDHVAGLFDKDTGKIDFEKGKKVTDFKARGLAEIVKSAMQKF